MLSRWRIEDDYLLLLLLLLLPVGCLTSQQHFRDGSAQTIARAVALRQKLQTKLSHPVTVY